MPIYEYVCQRGHLTEVFQKLSDKPPKACPKCGAKLQRVLSQTSFQLKGGGWYKDLYSSVKPGGDGEANAGAAETKSEANSDGKAEAGPTAKPDVKKEAKAEAGSDGKGQGKTGGQSPNGPPAAKAAPEPRAGKLKGTPVLASGRTSASRPAPGKVLAPTKPAKPARKAAPKPTPKARATGKR